MESFLRKARKGVNRTHNTMAEKTRNDLQIITHKTKDRLISTSLSTGCEPICVVEG